MKKWFVGCSGFYYKHWRSGFYPKDVPVRRWFEYYCTYFNTVELNVTFYRFPKLESLQSWYNRSPDDFKFTVKAWKGITHYKKFTNSKTATRDFYKVISDGLKEKLGTVLFQLPPSFRFSDENLARILDTLDPAFDNVIEFRHESWWNEDVVKKLKACHIAFCGISHPSLPDEVMKTSEVVYYRFHGVPQLYRSSYTIPQMKAIADTIKKFRSVHNVYIYFNNDIEVSAIQNALDFEHLATGSNKLIRYPRAVTNSPDPRRPPVPDSQ